MFPAQECRQTVAIWFQLAAIPPAGHHAGTRFLRRFAGSLHMTNASPFLSGIKMIWRTGRRQSQCQDKSSSKEVASKLFNLQGGAEPLSVVPVWAQPSQLLTGMWENGIRRQTWRLKKNHPGRFSISMRSFLRHGKRRASRTNSRRKGLRLITYGQPLTGIGNKNRRSPGARSSARRGRLLPPRRFVSGIARHRWFWPVSAEIVKPAPVESARDSGGLRLFGQGAIRLDK